MRGQIVRRAAGTYLVRVPRGRDANGKRLYHNRTIHGTKKSAQEYLAKVLREMDLGTFVERSKEPVKEYLRRWLTDTIGQVVRRKTAEDYRALMERHVIPRLGDLTLSQLSPEAIEKVYSEMSSEGLSPRTIAYTHSVLHNALGYAVQRGHLARNPAAMATRPRQSHKEMRSLTAAEAATLLEAAGSSRFEALWMVLLAGGLRPAEALGLKWSDFDGSSITVQRSLVCTQNGEFIEESPKTARARRTVPLPTTVIKALREHKARQNEARLRSGVEWQERGLVFCNEKGGPLEWRVLARRYFRPLLKEAGLSKVRPYDLRHTCASLLLANGENAKVVSERLGHSKVALTLDVYGHVLPGMQKAATDKLETILFAKPADNTAVG